MTAHLMSSSVTMKALHRGWAVLSHTPGFFSTAADSWPVIGAALVCRALAIADRRVLSVQPGPTPEERKQQRNDEEEKTNSPNKFIPTSSVTCDRSVLNTLKAFRQLHRFHQLLGDVVGVQTAELLLPKQLQKKKKNSISFKSFVKHLNECCWSTNTKCSLLSSGYVGSVG